MNLLKTKRGIALVLVISSISLLSLLMVDFTFNTQVNLQITKNFQNALKARALARSGIYFGMLELKVHQTLKDMPMLKQIPGFQPTMLDLIWQFGFIYPPMPGKSATFGAQKAAVELVSKSKIDGNISVRIQDEGAKINLNDLGDPKLQKATAQQLETLFEQRKSTDEDFFRNYRDVRFRELIHNIVDWIDKDSERVDGGSEESIYSRLEPAYKHKNAPLDTTSELSLIDGFQDSTIFNLLLPLITVYSTGGINVNTADATTLKSMSIELTDEDVAKIIEQRQKVPFKNTQAFEDFCKKTLLKSATFNQDPKIAITTTTRIFSLESTAEVHGALQTIRAVVDTKKIRSDGMPQIVYWNMS
ncbi:MAG: type II secretion system minor pseudopilin GspK [Deltaproteobacteria bacterium]|nr:type II secretion system minor pseudopilin GspK [Deltaproteobacteria bacterium]